MNSYKSKLLFPVLGLMVCACAENHDKLYPIEALDGPNRADISSANEYVKLDEISLPENFEISLWAADVPNARSLARSEEGVVFVGNRGEGKVYAVIDEDADGKADYRYTLAEGLKQPNGVAYKDGDLYVSQVNKIIRFKDIKNHLTDPTYEVIFDGYPTEKHHGHKFIAFGPDGYLYVSVGAPCNICDPEDEIFASITRIDVCSDNIVPEVVAHGVRNSIGFDWHPDTQNLWFTDNNRDRMGDDLPSCELNELTEIGQHFGYPYWHAQQVKDPEFGEDGRGAEYYEVPRVDLGAHVAPLGMRFYKGSMFPEDYKKKIFIAEHGSWNRSKKVGYKITLVDSEKNNGVYEETTFAEGWLDHASQEVWGRPVDVMELTDGSLLISDDMSNCIYRVSYKE